MTGLGEKATPMYFNLVLVALALALIVGMLTVRSVRRQKRRRTAMDMDKIEAQRRGADLLQRARSMNEAASTA